MEFTDRYQALGIPYPDINTMCKGHCEGTGIYPLELKIGISIDEFILWNDAHTEVHSIKGRLKCLYKSIVEFDKYWLKIAFEKCDGWHFVKCSACNGTGKMKI
jgi:hypothetical protein